LAQVYWLAAVRTHPALAMTRRGAAPLLVVALKASTAASIWFDCAPGGDGWEQRWPLEKLSWCCQHVGRGCPKTTPAPFDCLADGHHHKAEPYSKQQVWCCEHEGVGCMKNQTMVTTSTTTTTLRPCDRLCEMDGDFKSCRSRMEWTAITSYLGNPKACQMARDNVVGQCPTCSVCTEELMSCGILDPLKVDQSDEERPRLMPGIGGEFDGSCDTPCVFAGSSATCRSRITWVSLNLYKGKPDRCDQSVKLVMGQCPNCYKCGRRDFPHLGCTQPKEKANEDENVAKEDKADEDSHDCKAGHSSQWSKAKKAWCCKHEHLCGFNGELFKKLFDQSVLLDPLSSSGALQRSRTVPLLFCIAGLFLLLAALAVRVSTRRRRQVSFLEVESLVLEEGSSAE